MNENFAIIGGDLRTVKLTQLLAKDKNTIYTYGLEKAEEIKQKQNIIMCNKLKEALKEAKYIIGPTPFSSNGVEVNAKFTDKKIEIKEIIKEIEQTNIEVTKDKSKKLIAGSISKEVYQMTNCKNIEIIDIMKEEKLTILNAISTAEGAIQIAMENTEKILHGSKCLILGFGRIAKILAKKLEGLSIKVTCSARKIEDLTWIKAYGYSAIHINNLNNDLIQYDLIINTIPSLILTKEKLKKVKSDCLLIDLASKPGGIDIKEAQNMGLKAIWALALPGKVAPLSSAEFIKDTIYNMLE